MQRIAFRPWALAAVAWLTARDGVSAGPYLAEDGPPRLRFAARAKEAGLRTALPPLAMTSADTGPTTVEVAEGIEPFVEPGLSGSGDPGSGTSVSMPQGTVVVSPSVPFAVSPAMGMPVTVVPGMTVAPQVLLNYFGSPGTNGVTTGVLAPVSFVPPQPGPPASSRATYRQVP